MKIQTVLGEVEPSKLGNILIHEHITYADRTLRDIFKNYFFDEEIVTKVAIRELKKAKEVGIDTIVDGSAINLGRDINMLKKISKESGVNIIVSTGFYYQNEIYLEMNDDQFIYDLVEYEIINGIENTNIKPGILKIACSSYGLNDIMIKTYKVIGELAVKYNLPIFCHHYPDSKNGIEIINILKETGVKESQIIMGHCGDSNDIEYLESLLKTGVYIGMDRFAFCDVSNSLENRVKTIVNLINKGYENKILLSHDFAVFFGVRESISNFKLRANDNFEISYDFISKKVIPLLNKEGVHHNTIEKILKENTLKILCQDK